MSMLISLYFFPLIVATSLSLLLAIEIFAACLSRKSTLNPNGHGARPSVSVIVPAHNEEASIGRTLESIKNQLHSADKLIVVADNCSDKTSEIARRFGAEVVEREDLENIGKGFALQAGADYQQSMGGADVIVFLDADCVLEKNTLERLGAAASEMQRPVQASYTIKACISDPLRVRVAAAAWRLKNIIRPKGLAKLGLPCHLTGSGMAFPSDILRSVPLWDSHLAEDMKLGLAFSKMGKPPFFVESAVVTSVLAPTEAGRAKQRSRWQHGHIALIRSAALSLIFSALRRLDFKGLIFAVDLCIPPLTILLCLQAACLAFAPLALLYIDGDTAWYMICLLLLSSVLLVTSFSLFWIRWCRDIISFADIFYIPVFIIRGSASVFLMVFKKQSAWKRSDRGDSV